MAKKRGFHDVLVFKSLEHVWMRETWKEETVFSVGKLSLSYMLKYIIAYNAKRHPIKVSWKCKKVIVHQLLVPDLHPLKGGSRNENLEWRHGKGRN